MALVSLVCTVSVTLQRPLPAEKKVHLKASEGRKTVCVGVGGGPFQMPMVCRTRLSWSLRWPENTT